MSGIGDKIKEKIAKGLLAPYLKGNRKLLAFLVYVGAVVGIVYTGKADGFNADTALQWGFGFFVGGNVGEHAANGKKKKESPAEESDVPAAGSTGGPGMVLLACLLGAGLLATPVVVNAGEKTGFLGFVDNLDIQLGPGLEVEDLSKFAFEPTMISTLMLYQEPRTKLELRVGGIFNEDRRAGVFNVTRDLTGLILRNDNGEDKVLLPPVGIWFGGDLISLEAGAKSIEFIWGFNAAYEF